MVRSSSKKSKRRSPTLVVKNFCKSKNYGLSRGEIYFRKGDSTVKVQSGEELENLLDLLEEQIDQDAIVIGEIQFAPVGRALIIGKNRGVLRLYVRKTDGLLLGASMCCVKAENLAHLITWSIQQGMTIFDILKMPFYHPVIEEALQVEYRAVVRLLDEPVPPLPIGFLVQFYLDII